MNITAITHVAGQPYHRVFCDAHPIASGDLVELWPRGLRRFVLTRTYLPELRAYEIHLDGVDSGHRQHLLDAGWEPGTRTT